MYEGPPHGTRSRYQYRPLPCRCDACRAANTEYYLGWRKSKKPSRSRVYPKRGPRQHGTRSCYVMGCREPECVQANRDYQRGYMWLHRQEIPMVDITDLP